jgi:NAD(P)-dependent dehydrogenase (short-subunit alcohol dehydrogenase family)
MSFVVITGGNRGIGWELATLYAAAGRKVILGVRNAPIAPMPKEVEVRNLDVGCDKSVASFAIALDRRPVSLLINNAGTIGPDQQSTLEMDFAGFALALNINTLGPLRVTQALLPNLRLCSNAQVAILTSRMGSLSYAKSDRLAYRASKAAANKVAQALATDLCEVGIAVAAIHPGWARTAMGGPQADISPDESAIGVKAVLDRLSIEQTGRFWNYDGTLLDW